MNYITRKHKTIYLLCNIILLQGGK